MLTLTSNNLLLPETSRTAMQEAFIASAQSFAQRITSAYPEPSGSSVLRNAIQEATPSWPGDVLVTNSATEALFLALRVVASQKGKKLALQVPCYFGIIRQAKDLGMEVIAFKTVSDLEKIESFDGLLLTSNFTPPHGRSLSETNKERIADIARQHDAFVIEDNPYDIAWYDRAPTAIPSDPRRAIRIGSLSKVASPDFRLGFIKAEADLFRTLRSQKITINLSSPSALQTVAAAALRPEVLTQLRQELLCRSKLLRKEIHDHIGQLIQEPEGGNFLCLPLPSSIDVAAFIKACADNGLALDNNAHYYPDGRARPYVRLHVGAIDIGDIPAAVEIMEKTMNQLSPVLKIEDVRGKNILVTNGTTKEVLDGVRHYANYSRSSDHGLRVAQALSNMGAHVTLVTTKLTEQPSGIHILANDGDGKPIVSAMQMASTCEKSLETGAFDLAVNLANVSSLKPAQTTDKKLKVKSNPGDPVFLDVAPNVDVMAVLRSKVPAIGYDTSQLLEASAEWRGLIHKHLRSDRVVTETTREPVPQRSQPLLGRKIVVTSGPTVEQLTTTGDAISNFSSGRQGHEIACALADCGASVTLVSGPTTLSDPVHKNIQTIHVSSARAMRDACVELLPAAAYVGVAAVADFGIATQIAPLTLSDSIKQVELAQNPDILQTMGMHPTSRPSVVVGFAAETNDLETYARGKLSKKNADVIFANLVGAAMMQRGSGRNHVYRVTREGVFDCGETDKYQVGLQIARFISERLTILPTPAIGTTVDPS